MVVMWVNHAMVMMSEGVCLNGRGMDGSREKAVRRLRRMARVVTL